MGYYFVFKVNQSIIQSEIRTMIHSGFDKELIILIKINNNESNRNFIMLDHDEFSYCGRYFDIVKESIKGNMTWYYCVNDKQEERLIAGFEKIQTLASPLGFPDKTKHILALLHNLITFALVNDSRYSKKFISAEVNFCQYSFFTIKPILIPLLPPPKFS